MLDDLNGPGFSNLARLMMVAGSDLDFYRNSTMLIDDEVDEYFVGLCFSLARFEHVSNE